MRLNQFLILATASFLAVGCSGSGGGSGSGEANQAPIADAGNNQNIGQGSTVNLNGSNSTDPDGDLIAFFWSFNSRPAGSSATLVDADSATPSFIADVTGEYLVRLVVDDGEDLSSPSVISIVAVAGNSAPVANAGNDQSVVVGDSASLNGMASTDSDGDTLTPNWSFVSRPPGSTATLMNPGSFMPSFIADVAGNYIIELIVGDGNVTSQPDQVQVTANTDNTAPTSNAGFDQNVNTGTVAMLDGSQSNDADGDALSYTWAFVSMPSGSSATLVNSSTASPAFTPDVDGDYVLRLVVNDGIEDGQPDQVVVTAIAPSAGADVSPPTVSFIEVLNSPLDVSGGNARPQIRIRLQDDISGVDGDILGLRSPSGNQSNGAFITPSGTPTDFEAVLTGSAFSSNAETGIWRVGSVIVSDAAGNTDIVPGDELEARGFNIELEVTNQPGTTADTTPPTIEFIEVLNSPLDVSTGNARAQIRIRLSDDISGVDGDILGLRSPSGNQSRGAFITPSGNPLNFEATLTTSAFSQNAETGTWRISSVIVSDEAGNTEIVSGASLAARGFNIGLEVTN